MVPHVKRDLRRLEGLTHLAVDATLAVVNATEKIHRAYARRPFGLLERVETLSAPARAVEDVEAAAAGTIYAAIRTIAGMSGDVVVHVLGRLEKAEGGNAKTPFRH